MTQKSKISVALILVITASLACRMAQKLIGGEEISDPGDTVGEAVQDVTPQPTIVPTLPVATITATVAEFSPEPGLLFVDEFSDRSSGWSVEYGENSVIDYFQDGYHILVSAPESIAISVVGPNFGNVRIIVDAQLIGGNEDNYFGLICRYQDSSNFYTGVISSDGFSAIMHLNNGTFEFVSSDRWEESVVINQHQALNLVQLTCIDNHIALTVNGQEIAAAEVASIPTGEVGLIVGTISAEATDVLFDNFTLYLEE